MRVRDYLKIRNGELILVMTHCIYKNETLIFSN